MIFIGVDYSGAKTADDPLDGLRVYSAKGGEPVEEPGPRSSRSAKRNWTRREIADRLMNLKADGTQFVAGIDHALSFPRAYFESNGLASWATFLSDFVDHWPTHDKGQTVEMLRSGNARLGNPAWYRVTETWASSCKSVFDFDVRQGQVAKATHAGLPWIREIRKAPGEAIHFWPFDGWDVPIGRSVIAEVYPSIFRRRYSNRDENSHRWDAYATARWLLESHERGFLERYFHPSLTREERDMARLEGWILGIC